MRALMQRTALSTVAVGGLVLADLAGAQRRPLRPEDLFRLQRIGAIAWSPNGKYSAVEVVRPGRSLGERVAGNMMAIVDVASAALRVVSPASADYVGFFGAAWSPNGQRLLFLSLDTTAIVRPWLWEPGRRRAVLLANLELRDATADPPTVQWSDNDHAVMLLRERGMPNEGPLYAQLHRGRNVARARQRAKEGALSVSVFDSRGEPTAPAMSRLASVNVVSGKTTTLARGPLHQPRLSADGRTLTYRLENPAFPSASVASYFGPEAQGDAAYDRVNWGSEVRRVDSRTGVDVTPPDTASPRTRITVAASLRVVHDSSAGSRLVLTRAGEPDTVIWRGNAWLREVELGRSEAIQYVSQSGLPLTGWLLYPPRHTRGRPIPVVTVVYPGTVYSTRKPAVFSAFSEHFQHPQVLAALGYGVVLPSMPEPERPMQARALDSLTLGVLPLLDTLVARGIADPTRIALLGQSAGGYATLGLITQSDRFRTAIASASYANLTSLYGTFYGQYRYGDAGHAQRAQLLRMLQFERGYYGAAAPPWDSPDRYRANSPIERVARVRTPLMLIHGDMDFIPVQQAEEFFTALYRQDKRVRLLRYSGEGHTISARANVLDMWRQIAAWLAETMP